YSLVPTPFPTRRSSDLCLSCLPQPEPSCDLTKKVVEHIAAVRHRDRIDPITLTSIDSPVGRLYVGFKDQRIAYIGLDRGDSFEKDRKSTRLNSSHVAIS